jgi:hypothetical protein
MVVKPEAVVAPPPDLARRHSADVIAGRNLSPSPRGELRREVYPPSTRALLGELATHDLVRLVGRRHHRRCVDRLKPPPSGGQFSSVVDIRPQGVLPSAWRGCRLLVMMDVLSRRRSQGMLAVVVRESGEPETINGSRNHREAIVLPRTRNTPGPRPGRLSSCRSTDPSSCISSVLRPRRLGERSTSTFRAESRLCSSRAMFRSEDRSSPRGGDANLPPKGHAQPTRLSRVRPVRGGPTTARHV